MGIRKAARADIPVWTLADLEADVPAPLVRWPEVVNPAVREITNEIISGDSPDEIAETLADKIIGEKVL
jgi:electron transfer flavoprotein alpha/beta subunit